MALIPHGRSPLTPSPVTPGHGPDALVHPLAERPVPARELALTTRDGSTLAAHLYTPRVRVTGAVLIAPAMAVPQSFYAAFAQWLAAAGLGVLTFDYRGMGASRRGSLRGFDADITTWAEEDAGAALEALAGHFPGVPLRWVGHSLGGQIVPLVPGHERLATIVTVSAGGGYWRDNAPALRRKVPLFWWGAVPLATPLFGYFPGKRLGMVGDLPTGVIRQWRKWCLDPDYLVGVEGPALRARFEAVTTPITAFAFDDDAMMSERSITSLHAFYRGARVTMHRFAPHDLGVPAVGHFGFFKPAMAAPLWERYLRAELTA